jgi:hypothetical protein
MPLFFLDPSTGEGGTSRDEEACHGTENRTVDVGNAAPGLVGNAMQIIKDQYGRVVALLPATQVRADPFQVHISMLKIGSPNLD